MSSNRKFIWLKGDYVGNHERQAQAQAAGCKLVIEFHFNSNGSTAVGGETWFKPNDSFSLKVATDIRNRYLTIGLPLHGDGPNAAVSGTRAGWLPFYSCSAILLEPLYVSNPVQARWIHQPGNVDLLAGQIAEAVVANTDDEDLIGLSIGHRFKHSQPNDTGAPCALGDSEADHGTAVAEAVASKLGATEIGGGDTVPVAENPILKSPLFQGNPILEGVAAGHLVLTATGARVNGIGPVQDALNQLGFTIDLGGDGQFRGFFGQKTEAALEAFQNRHSLEITGELRKDDIFALDEALVAPSDGPLPNSNLGLLHPGGDLPKRLPKYAEPVLSADAGVPWQKAKALPDFNGYDGVLPDSVCLFEGLSFEGVEGLTQNVTTALIYECKLTIDSDGSAEAGDISHQGQTSLRRPDPKTSLNAGEDSFAVIPLDATEAAAEGRHKNQDLPDFGAFQVQLGDIGVAFWEKTQEITVFIIGDKGPPNALGEGSIKMADDLQIPSDPSNGGFNSKDVKDMGRGVMHILFPGSSDAVKKKGIMCIARDNAEIAALGKQLFDKFRNQG